MKYYIILMLLILSSCGCKNENFTKVYNNGQFNDVVTYDPCYNRLLQHGRVKVSDLDSILLVHEKLLNDLNKSTK